MTAYLFDFSSHIQKKEVVSKYKTKKNLGKLPVLPASLNFKKCKGNTFWKSSRVRSSNGVTRNYGNYYYGNYLNARLSVR